MPYLKVWIHMVWSTKRRAPVLSKKLRPKLFCHIEENAEKKEIHLEAINGYYDHVHCLIRLGSKHSLSEVAQLLKGESSFWINREELTPEKFEWQREYYAASVSEDDLHRVRTYIRNQERHHQNLSLEKELEALFDVVEE